MRTERLRELQSEVQRLGRRQEEIDEDNRLLEAAATGEPFQTASGELHEAPILEDVRREIEKGKLIRENLDRITEVLLQVSIPAD